MGADGDIEPHCYDVIVLGTGLQEAMIAAAAAASRLTVLHLDPHDFYGSHWTSFDFDQFSSWAASGGRIPVPSYSREQVAPDSSVVDDIDAGRSTDPAGACNGLDTSDDSQRSASSSLDEQPIASVSAVTLGHSSEALRLEEVALESGKPWISDVKFSEYGVPLGPPRSFSVDICGPRLTLCGSEFVNVLLRSGSSNYVEFKGNDSSYIWTATGLSAVPSSRADVFQDKALSLPDKRYLMRFFSLVTDFANADNPSRVGIIAEDLDCSFRDFLKRQRLPTSIQSYTAVTTGGCLLIILYAIVLMDGDEDANEKGPHSTLMARDGLHKLALYLSSVARFQNARGAFLYPLYGQGELSQAFCRSAAVNGALYVLRRPVKALLIDKDSKEYKGIRTFQGQDLLSKKLVMGPSYLPATNQEGDYSSKSQSQQTAESPATLTPSRKTEGCQVARCVCITDRSLVDGQDTIFVVFPPHSVQKTWSSVIRAVQLSSTASVCPKDKYILQLSTSCNDVVDGQVILEAVLQILLQLPGSETAKVEELHHEVAEQSLKPILLWSAFYGQALRTPAEDLRIPGVSICTVPDETVDYESILHSTEEIFRKEFPNLEFFPKSIPQDTMQDAEGESEAALEAPADS